MGSWPVGVADVTHPKSSEAYDWYCALRMKSIPERLADPIHLPKSEVAIAVRPVDADIRCVVLIASSRVASPIVNYEYLFNIDNHGEPFTMKFTGD